MHGDRIRNKECAGKIMEPGQAAAMVKDGMTLGCSGFTPAGYPKCVPMALAGRVTEGGENLRVTLCTGASVGDELDGSLARAKMVAKRLPYQTTDDMRSAINEGLTEYTDLHLSQVGQYVRYGFLGKIDLAIVEAVAITEDGHIVPSTSVGCTPSYVQMAEKVIVEVNTTQPLDLMGMSDIYTPEDPPGRKPIPILKADDRIGTPYIPCGSEKIAAVVMCGIKDGTRALAPVDEAARAIAGNLIDFFENEVRRGRLPVNLLPLQSGVGSVANGVLAGLTGSRFENLSCYTEVVQDSMLDLIDAGKTGAVSCTSLTLSGGGLKRFYEGIGRYRDVIIMRPQEISNNPEVARRLGVIAMNTAIECDIYGNVNSTHIMGSRMMNGIGGSGDFARNGYLTIFTTESTARKGAVSSIVPMCSHVDHTEHDVMVIITEQGVADMRGLSPKERAKVVINNCAHPDYRPMLRDYFERAAAGSFRHTPHLLREALSWHARFSETGSMKA
ncbi:MAG TPA: acetyl-CoA hydrolase/transferase family protein [Spirochaetes bacterium]|nr:acetyl-CoA hydrolase/transferase family protein [Spirochaetota bacterium]